jgi:hypothetical protein
MTRLRIAPMALLAGCIFITQADREARQADDDDTGVGSLGDDDDDVWGDDDDDNAPEGWVPGIWRAVSVGLEASCAIDDQFDLQCWSTNDDPSVDWFPAIPDDLDFVGVSMGLRGGCAWNADGVTRCFGSPTGSQYEPVRAYLDQPGTYDKVTCGSGVCCGLGSDASFTCWDEAPIPDVDWNLLDTHLEGVVDIAGTGDWCVIDAYEDTLDCFTRGFTGGEEPAWAQARFTSLHASWGNHVCAVAQENEVGCWLVSSSAGGGLTVMDAPPASELKDLHAYSNAQVPNICGLRAGVFQCFAPEFQSTYEPETPAGSWNKLSLGVGGGCLLDVEQRMACWGEEAHLPHNAR